MKGVHIFTHSVVILVTPSPAAARQPYRHNILPPNRLGRREQAAERKESVVCSFPCSRESENSNQLTKTPPKKHVYSEHFSIQMVIPPTDMPDPALERS